MPNTYYEHTVPIARFITADATRLNASFKAIEAAFDKFPSATELAQGSRNYSVSTNIGNAYSITVPWTVSSYTPGLQLTFLAGAANTAAATLNVNNVGPATIRRFDGTNLLPNDIGATSLNSVVFEGTSFRLISMHGGTESLATSSATSAALSAANAAVSAAQALASRNAAAASESSAASSAATSASALTGTRFGLRNLLINPMFWMSQQIPGVLSGTHATGFGIRDRWRTGASGATWSVSNQTMTITAGSVLQIVQGRNIHFSGSYTLSWTGTSTARVNGVVVANGGSVTLPAYTHATVEFLTGTFSYAQLEWGSIKTQFELRHNDLERLLCYQYYQKSYNDEVAPGTVTYNGVRESVAVTTLCLTQGVISLTVPMRAVPSITIYQPLTANLPGFALNMENLTNKAVSIDRVGEKSFTVVPLTVNFTLDHRYRFHWIANAEI